MACGASGGTWSPSLFSQDTHSLGTPFTTSSLSPLWASVLLPSHKQWHLVIPHLSLDNQIYCLFLTLPVCWWPQKYAQGPTSAGLLTLLSICFQLLMRMSLEHLKFSASNAELLFHFPPTVLIFLLFFNEGITVYPRPNCGGQSVSSLSHTTISKPQFKSGTESGQCFSLMPLPSLFSLVLADIAFAQDSTIFPAATRAFS